MLIVVASLLVAACGSDGGSSEGDTAEGGDGLLEIGKQVYATMCASCHGAEGEGAAGPGFDGVVERFPEVADHIELVEDGKGVMPPFGGTLDDTEIEAVVAYEREVLDSG